MFYLKDYAIYPKHGSLILNLSQGKSLTIYFDHFSGKPCAREKVNTLLLSWVNHAGIRLGVDDFGRAWYAHNHVKYGTVVIAPHEEFAQGKQIEGYDIACNKSHLDVIKSILNQAKHQKQYDWNDYNCQTSVNVACNNTAKSDDVDLVKTVVGVGAVVLVGGLLLKAFFSKK